MPTRKHTGQPNETGGVTLGKQLIERLRKQAVRETTKHQRLISVAEIVKAAVEAYLSEWETGIETAEFFDGDGNPETPAIQQPETHPSRKAADDLAGLGEGMPAGASPEGNCTVKAARLLDAYPELAANIAAIVKEE